MKITKRQLRSLIRESLITELFGFDKKKPDDYRRALKDGGLTDRNIEVAMPNMPQLLADKKVDLADVVFAVKELLRSPRDHSGGIPSAKAVYNKLKAIGATR